MGIPVYVFADDEAKHDDIDQTDESDFDDLPPLIDEYGNIVVE